MKIDYRPIYKVVSGDYLMPDINGLPNMTRNFDPKTARDIPSDPTGHVLANSLIRVDGHEVVVIDTRTSGKWRIADWISDEDYLRLEKEKNDE